MIQVVMDNVNAKAKTMRGMRPSSVLGESHAPVVAVQGQPRVTAAQLVVSSDAELRHPAITQVGGVSPIRTGNLQKIQPIVVPEVGRQTEVVHTGETQASV